MRHQGLRDQFSLLGEGVADGLKLRHDHGLSPHAPPGWRQDKLQTLTTLARGPVRTSASAFLCVWPETRMSTSPELLLLGSSAQSFARARQHRFT